MGFPLGLVVALALYAAALVGYVYVQYWSSPEYIAAEKFEEAHRIMGLDECAKCNQPQLTRAMTLMLECSRLMPEEMWFPKQVERLRWQFEQKKFALDKDLQRKAELVSAAAYKIEKEKKPWLVVGAHDMGWAPAQVLAGPQRALLWGTPGFALIFVFWLYLQLAARKARKVDHEQNLRHDEQKLAELGEFREGLDALGKKQKLKTAALYEPDTDPDSTDPRR